MNSLRFTPSISLFPCPSFEKYLRAKIRFRNEFPKEIFRKILLKRGK
jgi:hypothetical protein